MSARDAFAIALCDCWFEVCEEPTRWSTASAEQRRTFLDMADFAIAAGKRGERDVERLAVALCLGFWLNAANRPTWSRAWVNHFPAAKEVFRICARRLLAVAAELRAKRGPANSNPMRAGEQARQSERGPHDHP